MPHILLVVKHVNDSKGADSKVLLPKRYTQHSTSTITMNSPISIYRNTDSFRNVLRNYEKRNYTQIKIVNVTSQYPVWTV